MNDQSNNNPYDWIEEKRRRHEERRAYLGGNAWLGGAALVLIGLLLLGQNMKIVSFENWWALFILLPAFGSFGTAWRITQAEGRFTVRARGAAFIGLVVTMIAVMFLFSLNWTIFGPALLILAGLGLIINNMIPE